MPELSPAIRASVEAGALRLEARVAGAGGDALTWRLTVDTAGDGGRSRIVQTGSVGAARPDPLATVRVTAGGEVLLEIFRDGVLATSASLTFPAPGATASES